MVVDELLSFISQKLIRQGRDSYQARRKAWLRQKRKVVALGDRLKEARENVSVALNTSLLYVDINWCFVVALSTGQEQMRGVSKINSDMSQDQRHTGSI